MATKRMISSELFMSADLMDLPAMARLLFAGMICNADDEGMGRAEIDYLRTKILPGLRAGRDVVRGYLDTFDERGMIKLRTLNGVTSYLCCNWANYQKLRHPRKSKFSAAQGNRIEEKRMEGKMKTSAAEQGPDRMGQSADSPELSGKENPTPTTGSSGPLPFGRSSVSKTEDQAILVDEIARGFCIGYAKAGICVYELGVTEEDWKAWRKYEDAAGTRLAVMNIQRYRNPADIPAPKEGQQGEKPKSFRERDRDAAKADAARLRERGEE